MLSRINVIDIVREHFRTLKDDRDGSSWRDALLFAGGPAIGVILEIVYSVQLSDTVLTVLATALSIIAGLLFNLLVLLHTLPWDRRVEEPWKSQFRKALEEIHLNLAYAIVVSLVALVPLAVASNYPLNSLGRLGWGWVTSYLSIHFVLSMLMVLKRMCIGLQKNMKETM